MTTTPSPAEPALPATPPGDTDTDWLDRGGFPPGTFAAPPQPRPKVKLRFEAAEGSRAAALLAQLPHLEAEARTARDELERVQKAIQSEIAATIDNPDNLPDGWYIAEDPFGGWPAYNLTSNPGKLGLDTAALKDEEPGTYGRFLKRGRPYWSMSRVQKNRVRRG